MYIATQHPEMAQKRQFEISDWNEWFEVKHEIRKFLCFLANF